jgi:hypothetical protein
MSTESHRILVVIDQKQPEPALGTGGTDIVSR